MLNSYNYSYSSLTFNILHHIFLFPAGTAAVNIYVDLLMRNTYSIN